MNYTRTVFEFITPVIGAQSTVCGGGRYDGLVKEIGGPNLSGIGFAMGITRLILALEALGKLPSADYETDLYIASMGKDAAKVALTIANEIRNNDLHAESDLVSRSLKAQMKYADKKSARFTLILGDNELATGKANLKNMKTSEQTEVDIHDIPALLALIR